MIINLIANHPNKKALIYEILNEKASFLYETFAELGMWSSPDEVKRSLKKALEAYLMTQNNLKSTISPVKSYKEFLDNEETVYSAMDYIYRTLREKNGGLFLVSLIALWVALERKEGEFFRFKREYFKENPSWPGETLTSFWLLGENL